MRPGKASNLEGWFGGLILLKPENKGKDERHNCQPNGVDIQVTSLPSLDSFEIDLSQEVADVQN